jgi:hypothetical protein
METHPPKELRGRTRQPKTEGGPRIGRHRELLGDPKVRSWWEARALRSQLSADQYLRQFGFLLEHLKLSPAEIVALAKEDPDRLRDLLIRDAAKLKREGKLDSYVSKFAEGLKSYLRFHHVSFDGFPSLSPIRGASLANERVPTPEELNRTLDRLSLRGRVCALFMAHSGLRPGVLGSYQARAGLTLGDLPELKLGKVPTFSEVPFIVRVPANLSKTRVAYTTFGTSQLASTFLAYLAERREAGEKLSASSPVAVVLPTRGAANLRRKDVRFDRGFLTTTGVAKEIHRALVSSAPAGVRFRVYVLRSYCSTRLLMAEGAGKISRDLRDAILGHDGGAAARYNVGKRWGDELLNEARSAYKRCEPFLSTVPVADDLAARRQEVVQEVLVSALGVSPEDYAKVLAGDMKVEEMLSRATGKSGAPTQKAGAGDSSSSAKVLPSAERRVFTGQEEIKRALVEWWDIVREFGESAVLQRSPPG